MKSKSETIPFECYRIIQKFYSTSGQIPTKLIHLPIKQYLCEVCIFFDLNQFQCVMFLVKLKRGWKEESTLIADYVKSHTADSRFILQRYIVVYLYLQGLLTKQELNENFGGKEKREELDRRMKGFGGLYGRWIKGKQNQTSEDNLAQVNSLYQQLSAEEKSNVDETDDMNLKAIWILMNPDRKKPRETLAELKSHIDANPRILADLRLKKGRQKIKNIRSDIKVQAIKRESSKRSGKLQPKLSRPPRIGEHLHRSWSGSYPIQIGHSSSLGPLYLSDSLSHPPLPPAESLQSSSKSSFVRIPTPKRLQAPPYLPQIDETAYNLIQNDQMPEDQIMSRQNSVKNQDEDMKRLNQKMMETSKLDPNFIDRINNLPAPGNFTLGQGLMASGSLDLNDIAERIQ